MNILKGNKTLSEIASLAAKHKLVPFLGAGSSIKHLAIDWDSLAKELAQELGIDYTNNLEVAEMYESTKGKKRFCEFLKM